MGGGRGFDTDGDVLCEVNHGTRATFPFPLLWLNTEMGREEQELQLPHSALDLLLRALSPIVSDLRGQRRVSVRALGKIPLPNIPTCYLFINIYYFF